jgi:hypothetical protein
MNRLLYAVVGAAVALMPLVVAASPSPTPTLDTLLAAPPSGFQELTTSTFHGSFSAHDYATVSDPTKATAIEATLTHDGFVGGYGKTWVQQAATHALLEAVIAFTGGHGARDWLTAAEAGDKSDPSYVHADSMSGIDTYYGGHFNYATTSTVGDFFSFVKGNDVFLLGFVSRKDDVLNLATAQAKAQFDSAPADTIPSSQWPENATHGLAFNVGVLIVPIIVVILLIVFIAVVISRRRATPAMVPAAVPGMGVAAATPATIQMSADGRFWWDGQAWKDTEQEIPPNAQRSGDGQSWWDGRGWRPVPRTP